MTILKCETVHINVIRAKYIPVIIVVLSQGKTDNSKSYDIKINEEGNIQSTHPATHNLISIQIYK